MKKLISLMMILSLMILPAASLAEVTTTPYILSDIGVAMDLPAGWYTATLATAGNCSLNAAFGLTEADTLEMLNSMGASLYGVCDDFGITHMAVISAPGIGLVDMREDDLSMDSFMLGFLSSYSNVKDSGYFKTDAAWFAYVQFTQADATGNVDTLQFVTNVNGKLYVIQFMSMYGVEINEISSGLFRQAVETIRFIEN